MYRETSKLGMYIHSSSICLAFFIARARLEMPSCRRTQRRNREYHACPDNLRCMLSQASRMCPVRAPRLFARRVPFDHICDIIVCYLHTPSTYFEYNMYKHFSLSKTSKQPRSSLSCGQFWQNITAVVSSIVDSHVKPAVAERVCVRELGSRTLAMYITTVG